MRKYYIEHRVNALLNNFNLDKNGKIEPFKCLGLEFEHWDFNLRDGCRGSYWLVSETIKGKNGFEAIKIFKEKLNKLTSRIAFVGQAYISFDSEPFFIRKSNDLNNTGLFYYSKNRKTTGLTFDKNEVSILEEINKENNFNEFYFYWRDAVNTTGYSGKLVLILCALESFCKNKAKNRKDYFEIREKILKDEELERKLFEQDRGLRHRLIHGEYFSKEDKENFVEIIHSKLIDYFNQNILEKNKIRSDIKSPQRHPFDNKYFGYWFIENKNNSEPFNLKNVLENFDLYWSKDPDKIEYDIIGGENLEKLEKEF